MTDDYELTSEEYGIILEWWTIVRKTIDVPIHESHYDVVRKVMANHELGE